MGLEACTQQDVTTNLWSFCGVLRMRAVLFVIYIEILRPPICWTLAAGAALPHWIAARDCLAHHGGDRASEMQLPFQA